MTGPDPDAAGLQSAAVDSSLRDDPPSANPIDRLRQRWWLIAGGVVVALFAAFVYLTIATPQYDVTAILMAEHAEANANTADFLAAQRRALLSPPVQTEDVAKFYPTVAVDPTEATLTVGVETDKPREAAKAMSAMLDRYLKTSGNPASVAQKLAELAAQREKLAAERDAKTKALAEFRAQTKLSGSGADAVVNARREQIAAALKTAQLQAAAAKDDSDVAAKLPSDPFQLTAVVDAARAKGAFKDLDQQRAETKARLDEAEAKLEVQKQTLLSQHPALIQTQKTVEQLKARQTTLETEYPQAYRTWAAQQLATAQKKVIELEGLLAQQAQNTQQAGGATEKLAQLEADVKKADEALAAADKQIRQTTVSSDNSITVKLVQSPTAPDRPSRPRRGKVLFIAAALGLIAGLALALAGRR